LNNFVKNLGITAFSALTPLLFFKLLVNIVAKEDVLAAYFQVKAVSTIVFYLLSLKFSDVIYFLKSKSDNSLEQLSGIHFAFALLGFVLAFCFSFTSYFLLPGLFPFISSLFLFISLEIIESKVTLLRLFNQYRGMYLIKSTLLFKPLFFWLFFKYYNVFGDVELKDIYLFEICFVYFLIFIFLARYFKLMDKFFYNIRYLVANKDVLKSTWFANIAKISYDSLPNFLLSLYASNGLYVEYNIARKIYGIIVTGQTSFIQVFNTLSIDFKNKFKNYLYRFYRIMIPANLFGLLIVFLFGDFFISILSHSKYANSDTFIFLIIMVMLSIVYLLLYPIRQWIILNGYLSYLTKSIVLSTLVICSVLPLIPFFGGYLVSVVQPFGQILPIIILVFILPNSLRKRLKMNMSWK